MLRAQLESLPGSENRDIAAEFFRLDGNALAAALGGNVAVLTDGMWQAPGDEQYTAVQFMANVVVEFLGDAIAEGLTIGPCHRLRIVGGSMWHVDGRELLARLDQKLAAWHVLARDGALMPACVIRPA